ncbi:MAG: NAD(P)/FAD-dependent oxidoreductase [Solirubrobacteraceae bacterium]
MSTVVVGAGIVGVCTAFELTRLGEQVTVIDQGDVSMGSTGLGEGNVLCGDKDAGHELELTIAGRNLYDELEEHLGAVAKIRRKGSLIVHSDTETWALEPERVARLAAAGVNAELIGADELRELEPELTGTICGASRFVDDLQCDPRAITCELAARAQARGCQLRTATRADAIAVRDGRAAGVEIDGELIAADTVVLAAGAWSGPLADAAGLPLPVAPRKGQLARLRLARPDERFLRHKIVDGSYLLSVASSDSGRQISTVIETTADGSLVVGSSRERRGFDPLVDPELASAMQARAARLVPGLADLAIEDVWVGFRPWLPDRLPAIGASRQVPGLVVGTGHEGSGVALGPITGRLLAQLISGRPTDVDLSPFDPDRFV